MSDEDEKKVKTVNMSRKSAVALSYKETKDSAPKVVAKGRGEIAKKIIETAKANGVYVHESPELVSLLMQVDLDAYIPPKLYVVVAELLAWLYHLERDQEYSAYHKAAMERILAGMPAPV
jgi:flagellar biosynthesis protein